MVVGIPGYQPNEISHGIFSVARGRQGLTPTLLASQPNGGARFDALVPCHGKYQAEELRLFKGGIDFDL